MYPPSDNPQGYPSPQPQASIRFDVIGQAWGMFTQQMGNWIVAELVALVAGIVIFGIIFGVQIPIAIATSKMPLLVSRLIQTVISFIISVGVTAFMYVILGGYIRMALKQLRGEQFGVGDLFSITDVLMQLLMAGVVVGLVNNIFTLLNFIPILSLLTLIPRFIISILVSGLTMFAVPLIVDKGLSGIDALRTSATTLKPQLVMACLFMFVIGLISGLGIVACCIGILFTAPLAYLSISILYHEHFYGVVGYPSPASDPMSAGYMPPTMTNPTPPTPTGFTPPTPPTSYPSTPPPSTPVDTTPPPTAPRTYSRPGPTGFTPPSMSTPPPSTPPVTPPYTPPTPEPPIPTASAEETPPPTAFTPEPEPPAPTAYTPEPMVPPTPPPTPYTPLSPYAQMPPTSSPTVPLSGLTVPPMEPPKTEEEKKDDDKKDDNGGGGGGGYTSPPTQRLG